MPIPEKGESKDSFIPRCMKYVIDKEGLTQEEASGKCLGMWENRMVDSDRGGTGSDSGDGGRGDADIKPSINLVVPAAGKNEGRAAFMKRCIEEKRKQDPNKSEKALELECSIKWDAGEIEDGQQPKYPGKGNDSDSGGGKGLSAYNNNRYLFCLSCEHIQPLIKTDVTLDMKASTTANIVFDAVDKNEFKATCLFGDRFYKGKFISTKELQKAAYSLENSYHDINHWGTTYLDGHPNIEYIVGYQDHVNFDPVTKALTADIHILETTEKYRLWRGFLDINRKINRVPNVSVSFYGSKKNMKAGELGIDLGAYALHADDDVEYIYDIEFQALSTVMKGACNDKDGCGISLPKNNDMKHDDKRKKLELMIEIERNKMNGLEER